MRVFLILLIERTTKKGQEKYFPNLICVHYAARVKRNCRINGGFELNSSSPGNIPKKPLKEINNTPVEIKLQLRSALIVLKAVVSTFTKVKRAKYLGILHLSEILCNKEKMQ